MLNLNDEVSRRQFFAQITIALSALAGLVIAIPIVGYVLSPLIRPTPAVWRSLGPVSKFKVGDTVKVSYQDPSPQAWAGLTAKTAVWARRDTESPPQFTVFAVNCAHLGCPVHWLPDAQIFLCPCHGGVYYANGSVAAGPPPRGLFQYKTRVVNNEIQIQTMSLPIG